MKGKVAHESRLRLVYLIGFLGFGGSERQLFLLLSHMDLRDMEVHVVVFNDSPGETYEVPLRALGVQVWQMPPEVRGVVARARYLLRLFRRLRPQVVHSWTFHDNVYAGLVGWLAGVPRRWGSLRNSYYAREVQHLPAGLRWLALYSGQRLVVNSQALADELRAARLPGRLPGRFPAGRILVLPNCVELAADDAALPDLAEFGLEARHQVVGIVGNLRYQKNHLLFVEAMAQVIAQRPLARGLIVGQPLPLNPGVAEEIRAAIARHGLQEKVLLAGFRADVPALMRRFDVLAMSSRYEGMPNVVMEGMAAGCPVVATRVGGVPDLVVAGVNGFVVPPDDAAAFAAAVGRLLADPAGARAMGEAGRRMAVEQFGCRQMAARLRAMYWEAIGNG